MLLFSSFSFFISFIYLPYLEGLLGSSHPKSQLSQGGSGCGSTSGIPLPLPSAEALGYPPAATAHGNRSRVIIIAAAPGARSPHVTVPLHAFVRGRGCSFWPCLCPVHPSRQKMTWQRCLFVCVPKVRDFYHSVGMLEMNKSGSREVEKPFHGWADEFLGASLINGE